MKKLIFSVAILSVLFTVSCQELLPLLQQMNVQKPKARISKVKLTGLNFQSIALNFKIAIENPNGVAVTLAGFDYQLLIENNSFLKGEQNETIKIEAHSTSEIDLPVSLSFKELYKTFKGLKKADSVKYTLNAGLTFDLPVLGKQRIPLQTSGRVPNLKLPQIKVAALKLTKLGFSGADLKLALEVDNPNIWSLALQSLSYHFVVNGQKWLEGRLHKTLKISQKQKQMIEIPVHLNFVEMGKSVYDLLTHPGALEYRLTGIAEMNSSIKLLGRFKLPINRSGKIKLLK